MALFALILLAGTSCEKKIDIEKEKEAIKALFEEDKAAYFNQDYNGMGECWAKEPSSTKIWISSGGLSKIDGWENINDSQKKETEDNSWDRKQVKATFSNYQIDVVDESAWVFCETSWEGILGSDTINSKQNRIVVLKRLDGKWKFAMVAIYQIPKAQPSNP